MFFISILSESKDNSPTLYEILFDEEFLGGLTLRCSSNRAYRLPSSCLLSISYGSRLEEAKKDRSGKSYTQFGTSYANAASSYDPSGQSTPPHYRANYEGDSPKYRVNYKGDPPYGYPGYQGYDAPDYHSSRYPATKPEYGNRDTQYGNATSRTQNSGRGKGKLESRKDKRNEKKTVLQRGSSKETTETRQTGQTGKSTETSQTGKSKQTTHSKDSKSSEVKGDEFSAAMSALTKLSLSPNKSSKEEPLKADQGTRELSPSVAAVFSAHKKQEALSEPAGVRASGNSDHTSNLKSILRISSAESATPVSPTEGDMPEVMHKLMGPSMSGQPRGPLLPGPPPFHHPQVPIRGT